MAGRHQPEAGADSPDALVQAGIDQGYQDHIEEMQMAARLKPGTQLGTRDVYVLETFRQDNGNLIGLLMTPYNTQPFVTCLIQDINKGSWLSGHYFDDIGEALNDYLKRAT